jgi:hypothetical protein
MKKTGFQSLLLQCRVNHCQELGGFESLLLHGAAGAGRGTCPATFAQGIVYPYLAFFPFGHDLYGIMGIGLPEEEKEKAFMNRMDSIIQRLPSNLLVKSLEEINLT